MQARERNEMSFDFPTAQKAAIGLLKDTADVHYIIIKYDANTLDWLIQGRGTLESQPQRNSNHFCWSASIERFDFNVFQVLQFCIGLMVIFWTEKEE